MKHMRIGLLFFAVVAATSLSAVAQVRSNDRGRDWDRDQWRDTGAYRGGTRAFQEGFTEGQRDAQQGRRARSNAGSISLRSHDRQEYQAGYNRGYQDTMAAANSGRYGNGRYGNGGYGNRSGQYPGGYGQPNGQTGQYGTNSWVEQARQIGYQDGINDGSTDRRTGHSFRPTQGDNYKHADRGYNSSYGDKNQYKQFYREGYQNAYPRGYNGR